MVGWIPLVPLDWSSSKLKVLSVFIGVGDLEADNWRPRIDAVERVLNSWRSRSLSFCGKALVVNALALSRVWYVASLVHMPPWALKELSSLAFSFSGLVSVNWSRTLLLSNPRCLVVFRWSMLNLKSGLFSING